MMEAITPDLAILSATRMSIHRSLLVFAVLVLVLGAAHLAYPAQHPHGAQKPVNEKAAALLAQLEPLRKSRIKAVAVVKKDPETTRILLDELRQKFDDSIQSARTRPEQRKVNYDADTLALGIWIGDLYGAATADRVPYRLFQARKTRIQGTELLNARSYRPAMAKLTAALAEAQALNDGWLTVITRLNLAYAHIETGETPKAVELCRQAVSEAKPLGGRAHALALIDLMAAHMHTGNYVEGVKQGEAAADAAREAGIRLWEGNALLSVGVAYRQLGDLERAQKTMERALDVILKTQDRLGQGRTFYNLAVVAADRQQYDAAAEYLERALPLVREVDLRHSHEIELDPKAYYNVIEEDALRQLVSLYTKLGRSEKVAEHQAALDLVLEKKPKTTKRTHH